MKQDHHSRVDLRAGSSLSKRRKTIAPNIKGFSYAYSDLTMLIQITGTTSWKIIWAQTLGLDPIPIPSYLIAL